MDTPLVAQYYREEDPKKRRRILEQSIAGGEQPEENAIRKELYEVRYGQSSNAAKDAPADGYLGLWMLLEYNRGVGTGLFGGGIKRACKEIGRRLQALRFEEYQSRGGLYADLHYQEVCHMVRSYMKLCQTDHTYNSTILGMLQMSEENRKNKLRNDIREVALELPRTLGMEDELALLTRAAREVYEEFYPFEGGLDGGPED